MGNKHEKIDKKKQKNKADNILDDDEEFFDDNMPKKTFKKKTSESGLDHNLLISQVKSDPFVDYTIVKEIGAGSFATVHLVKHNVSGAIRAMKAIQKGSNDDEEEESNENEIINEINILMKMDHPNLTVFIFMDYGIILFP